MYYPEGFRREGVWEGDRLQGEVRKYLDNETILEIWLEEGIYQGGAVNQVPHGKGTIKYFEEVAAGLQNFTGEFREGVKSGFGKMAWKDGSRYRGLWRNDVPEGKEWCRFGEKKTFIFTTLYRVQLTIFILLFSPDWDLPEGPISLGKWEQVRR